MPGLPAEKLMTKEEFAAALRELGLPPSSPRTAQLLGISNRQVFYYLSGRSPIGKPVERICRMLLVFQALDGEPF
jgi:predicted transcriptional regulator